MFLQVPAYPEVFRDSLHTYKLNEQDTDVRAALLLPLSTPAPPAVVFIFEFLLKASLPSISLLLVALHTFDSCPHSLQRQHPSRASSFSFSHSSHLLSPASHAGCVSPLRSRPLLSAALGSACHRNTDFGRRSVDQSTLCPAWLSP